MKELYWIERMDSINGIMITLLIIFGLIFIFSFVGSWIEDWKKDEIKKEEFQRLGRYVFGLCQFLF